MAGGEGGFDVGLATVGTPVRLRRQHALQLVGFGWSAITVEDRCDSAHRVADSSSGREEGERALPPASSATAGVLGNRRRPRLPPASSTEL